MIPTDYIHESGCIAAELSNKNHGSLSPSYPTHLRIPYPKSAKNLTFSNVMINDNSAAEY